MRIIKILPVLIALICPILSANAQDINHLKNLLYATMLKVDKNDNNFCRVIKNMGQDAVSCEIYQNYPDGHSELATRIDLEVATSDEPSILPPMTTKIINGFQVDIWQDKVYGGPAQREILLTTYIVKLKNKMQLHLTCWQNHKCFAEKFLEKLN